MQDVALFKKIDFLEGLSTLELAKISGISQRLDFEKGEEIVKEGDVCDSFYIIHKGSVKVLKGDKVINMLHEGSPLGEVSFIDRGPRSATAVANDTTVLFMIPLEPFEHLLKKEKEIAYKVYKSIAETLCQRLRYANNMLLFLSE